MDDLKGYDSWLDELVEERMDPLYHSRKKQMENIDYDDELFPN